MTKTKADSMLCAWLGLPKRIGQVQESRQPRDWEKLGTKLFQSFSDSCLWAEEKPSCEAGQTLTKVFNWIAINEVLVRGSGPEHTCKSRARCQEPVSVQVNFVSKWRQFSVLQIVFRFWADGIMFVWLKDYLNPLECDCETKSFSGRSVMSVSWNGILRARKSQQRKSARAGGRVLKNLSRVKWKSVARERPRSRSRENWRLPISESNRRRQNVQSRCGQCVGTQNPLHFLITQAWLTRSFPAPRPQNSYVANFSVSWTPWK